MIKEWEENLTILSPGPEEATRSLEWRAACRPLRGPVDLQLRDSWLTRSRIILSRAVKVDTPFTVIWKLPTVTPLIHDYQTPLIHNCHTFWTGLLHTRMEPESPKENRGNIANDVFMITVPLQTFSYTSFLLSLETPCFLLLGSSTEDLVWRWFHSGGLKGDFQDISN